MKTVTVNNKTYTLAPDGNIFRSIDTTLALVEADPKEVYDDFSAAQSFEIKEDGQTVGIYADFNHVAQVRYVGDAVIGYEDEEPTHGAVSFVVVEKVSQVDRRLDDLEETVVDLTDAILGG